MHNPKHGFVLKDRSLAARMWQAPRRYFHTLSDTLSLRFWCTEAAAAAAFAVGRIMAIPFVWVTAVVGATGLVALGFFVATQSFVREVRDDRRAFRRFRGP